MFYTVKITAPHATGPHYDLTSMTNYSESRELLARYCAAIGADPKIKESPKPVGVKVDPEMVAYLENPNQ